MPLRVLFLDMNSYFASVEQQLRPELRGRPVAVAAVDTDSTSCIAASREAKLLGIRTGTPVWQARMQRVTIVEARPPVYVKVHHAIREAVESCIPVERVCSIDEMFCQLDSRQAEPAAALEVARRVKAAVQKKVGAVLTCSIGLAPNRVLAKVAADMMKPDGLTMFADADLPHGLHELQLQDLPGVGPRMLPRLAAGGVTTMAELCAQSPEQMRKIWGGVVGLRWWQWLRGLDPPEPPTRHASVSHSHVLPPDLRTMDGARNILVRLIHKVAARLRRENTFARRMEVYLAFAHQEGGWRAVAPLGYCQDTLTMLETFDDLWRPPLGRPIQVAVTLFHLARGQCLTLPLFPTERHRVALGRALDRINDKFGLDTIHFAGMHGMKEAAPTRIGFTSIPELACEEELAWMEISARA